MPKASSMPILIANRRTKTATLQKEYGDPAIIDVTSKGPTPWVRFSPFYPHGGIPVPFSPGIFAASVEGIWQGLKVFENADVDPATLANTSMKGIKRTTRKFGRVLGHRAGLHGDRLLAYVDARKQIYLPSYLWVLENRLQRELEELRRLTAKQTVVLLDYETNGVLEDTSRPLSHASLVKRYLENDWPGP